MSIRYNNPSSSCGSPFQPCSRERRAYPSAESFGQALRAFGELVSSVELLSEMRAGDEAMLLYDMQVAGLGELRVVEHFTVTDGQIVRLRQIHDTAAVRAAGLAV